MAELERHSLFESYIYKMVIDPSLYNRAEILKTIYENYTINPVRNNWNNGSNLHHYFEDWDNEKFLKVDLSTLIPIYDKVFSTVTNSLKFKKDKKIVYTWKVVNIVVYDDSQYMQIHDHLIDNTIFTAIHYLEIPKSHSILNIKNPLLVAQYAHPILDKLCSLIDDTNTENSSYFGDWSLHINQNDMLIFPSFLKHQVKPSQLQNNDDKLRIAVVSNLDIDK
jgi:hypothetical protein